MDGRARRAWGGGIAVLVLGCLGLAPAATAQAPDRPSRAEFRRQVEADWLRRERYRDGAGPEAITTAADAAGGCDGIRDGGYGFHTGLAERPWWQVDLGEEHALGRVVVWNRMNGTSERAYGLRVLLSPNGADWRVAFAHDGTPFGGVPDDAPLVAELAGEAARFVRVEARGSTYLHLDEVEVFGSARDGPNLALHRPADQVSTSPWSTAPAHVADVVWVERAAARVGEILAHSGRLVEELADHGVDVEDARADLARLEAVHRSTPPAAVGKEHYLEARWLLRRLTLAHPLLDFDTLLFTKRVPGSFNHMSDQYLGWWSRPGGGLHTLRRFTDDRPVVERLPVDLPADGSFLRPMLSFDGRKILFAWCRFHPGLAAEPNKLDKGNVPADAFYHLFEVHVDGTGLRQLTFGKYDDFDGRYLPDGRIVFLSTRRGQAIQCGRESAGRTLEIPDLPDAYVRCGGGPERPCAVYTLHTMDADGGDLCAISPFEMFEWNPTVADDGTILYSRWDYVDRDNMPFMSLWAINPDGSNSRLVYGNFTRSLHCTFEPRSIPSSRKIVFTASAHHAQTKGSLVLLDPSRGTEGDEPITRLTPEVPFPEAEGWPLSYYAHPWPLSERFHLVCWGDEGAQSPNPDRGWSRWHAVERPANGMGLYVLDTAGNMELLYRDPDISSVFPVPLRARPRPLALADTVDHDGPREGRFLVADVYQGLTSVARGDVHALRIVAVPPKTHPTMNFPNLGLTRDDPGKCVLGTVPVEEDGSAHFRVPAGVMVFFQALDERGMAVQTMRSATHVQAGQTVSCIGCHESRTAAPPARTGPPLAALRAPSKLTAGPPGSWPLRFDHLVQPVLDAKCTSCHAPDGADPGAAAFDLRAPAAFATLVDFGSPSLRDHVLQRYREGASREGACVAARSALRAHLDDPAAPCGAQLDDGDLRRLFTWMDTYAQRAGSFGAAQEQRLLRLREESAALIE